MRICKYYSEFSIFINRYRYSIHYRYTHAHGTAYPQKHFYPDRTGPTCTYMYSTTCMYMYYIHEGRDEPWSGAQILETKKQPETVLLKYFYFPTEILSRCHVHPTFNCTCNVMYLVCHACIRDL